jgi:AraC-like DNA-binding protein
MNSGFAFRTGDYADPEAVEAAIRGRGMAFTVTEAGSYRSRLMQADVGGVWMQAADVSLPEIVEGNGPPGRIVLGFETIYGNSVRVNGLAPSADEAVLGSPDAPMRMRHGRGANWTTVAVPNEGFLSACRAVLGDDFRLAEDALHLVRPPPIVLSRLRHAHNIVREMASLTSPDLIAQRAGAVGAMLRRAVVDSVVPGRIVEESIALHRRRQVMARFDALLREEPEVPFQVSDVCEALAIPLRTLQAACGEFLGMGPKQYLVLRRLHLANRALRRAGPADTSVTSVALRCGFWELGRFAGAYRALFGEPPSLTLASAQARAENTSPKLARFA